MPQKSPRIARGWASGAVPRLRRAPMAADDAQQGAPAEHDLGAYLKAIRRRMPLILLLTGIVTAAAVLFSLAQTKEYEATARVVLAQSDPINNIVPNAQPINYDPESERN